MHGARACKYSIIGKEKKQEEGKKWEVVGEKTETIKMREGWNKREIGGEKNKKKNLGGRADF